MPSAASAVEVTFLEGPVAGCRSVAHPPLKASPPWPCGLPSSVPSSLPLFLTCSVCFLLTVPSVFTLHIFLTYYILFHDSTAYMMPTPKQIPSGFLLSPEVCLPPAISTPTCPRLNPARSPLIPNLFLVLLIGTSSVSQGPGRNVSFHALCLTAGFPGIRPPPPTSSRGIPPRSGALRRGLLRDTSPRRTALSVLLKLQEIICQAIMIYSYLCV